MAVHDLSGVAKCPAPYTWYASTTNGTVTVNATDVAGNVAQLTVGNINVAAASVAHPAAPVCQITSSSFKQLPNGAWLPGTPVTVTCPHDVFKLVLLQSGYVTVSAQDDTGHKWDVQLGPFQVLGQ